MTILRKLLDFAWPYAPLSCPPATSRCVGPRSREQELAQLLTSCSTLQSRLCTLSGSTISWHCWQGSREWGSCPDSSSAVRWPGWGKDALPFSLLVTWDRCESCPCLSPTAIVWEMGSAPHLGSRRANPVHGSSRELAKRLEQRRPSPCYCLCGGVD